MALAASCWPAPSSSWPIDQVDHVGAGVEIDTQLQEHRGDLRAALAGQRHADEWNISAAPACTSAANTPGRCFASIVAFTASTSGWLEALASNSAMTFERPRRSGRHCRACGHRPRRCGRYRGRPGAQLGDQLPAPRRLSPATSAISARWNTRKSSSPPCPIWSSTWPASSRLPSPSGPRRAGCRR